MLSVREPIMEKVDISKLKKEDFIKELPQMVSQLDAFRQGAQNKKPVEVTLGELVTGKWGITEDELFEKVGINPKIDTMENIFTMPQQDVRWIVPEIIRSAITLGMRQAPFYPEIIASDQSINGLTAIMPMINMSDAAPAKVNEAETIPLGDVSFGQKSVSLFKIGKGFKLTDEVRNYVSLDVLAIYLRDFGVQLGYAMDTLAMDVVINGNKPDGSESAPIIGVYETTNGITYKDLLHIWVRAARMGRNFTTMIGGEDQAIEMLNLPEFKDRHSGTTEATLNIKSPVPKNANFYIHPGTPDQGLLLIDTSAALIKLTAKQLMLESERIVSNQTQAIYASLTTGFSKMYQDAALILSADKKFSEAGFPDFMNIDPYLMVNLE
nr:MAG TPA: major capsid protein [Caudoviricetes sp.]